MGSEPANVTVEGVPEEAERNLTSAFEERKKSIPMMRSQDKDGTTRTVMSKDFEVPKDIGKVHWQMTRSG